MMMYDPGEIKGRADCRKIAGALGIELNSQNRSKAVWRGGDGWNVFYDKDYFKDHAGTGEAGDVFELVKRVKGCDFFEAVKFVADFYNIPPIVLKGKEQPGDAEAAKVKEYLKKRGLKPENIEFEIAYEFSFDHKENRLCMVFEFENIIQFIFLDGEKLFKKGHGPSGKVWKHSSFDPKKEVWIVESILDALTLIQCGYNAVCSFSAGNVPSKFYKTLPKKTPLKLAEDDDEAGRGRNSKKLQLFETEWIF